MTRANEYMIRRSPKKGHDFFETPPVAVEMLLDAEDLPGPVWEPACGRGAISGVLRGRGLMVHSTDVVDRGFGRGGVDFLERPRVRFKFRSIITNPPYNAAYDFALAALSYRPQKLALLLRMTWLETEKRARMFEGTRLSRVWIHSDRISMSRKHETGRGGFVPYAWFVWERGHRGPPRLGFLTRKKT